MESFYMDYLAERNGLTVQTSTTTETMSSQEIAELLGYEKKEVNRKIKRMFGEKIVGGKISPTFRSNGQVDNYYLPELESKMFVAKHDIEYLEQITQFWIDRHLYSEKSKQPKWISQLSPEAKIAIEDMSNQIEAAEGEVDRLQGVCSTLTAQFAEGMTACKFATQLNGVNIQKVNRYLVSRGVLHKERHGHSPTAYYRDRYFRTVITGFNNEKYSRTEHHFKPELTLKGARWLYKLYLNNELPMKKDWDGKHTHAVIPEDTRVVSVED